MAEESSSYSVRDRRSHFSEAGEGTQPSPKAPVEEEGAKKKEAVSEPGQKANHSEGVSPDVPVNFSSFILSLATSALIHLGEEVDPETGQKSIQLPNARQVIDLITLLEEKTKGNLSKEEKNLVNHLLYTLRMKCVALDKNQST